MIERILRRLDIQEYLSTRLAQRYLDDVLATIDIEELLQLRRGARDRIDNLHYLKYFNVRAYVLEQLKRAIYLGLHIPIVKDVLDIGTGFGYFPYICMFYRHRTKATDLPGLTLFDDVTGFLGVDKWHHRIEPFTPMPDFGTKFDIITGARVAFAWRPGLKERWGVEEWDFFLNDVVENQLKPGGRLLLDLNYGADIRSYALPAIDGVFRKYNGGRRLHRVVVQKPSVPVRRGGEPQTLPDPAIAGTRTHSG